MGEKRDIRCESRSDIDRVAYGFDWQEARCIGGAHWYMEECAKTISTTKPGAVLLIEMTSTKNTIVTNGICPTLTSRMGTGGGQVNAVLVNENIHRKKVL